MNEAAIRLRIGSARSGCEESLRILIDAHRSIIRAIAAKYFLPGADRDDLIQEGLIGLYKAIRDYSEDAGSSFSTFASLCAERQIQTAVRAANRLKHSPLNEYVPTDSDPGSDDEQGGAFHRIQAGQSSDPVSMVLTQESWTQVKKMVRECASDFETQVLSMSLDGMTYTEIAEAMGKNPKAVDNALQRIKRKVGVVLKAS